MAAVLVILALVWGPTLLFRPTRPYGMDELFWLVYSRHRATHERMLIFALIVTMALFFICVMHREGIWIPITNVPCGEQRTAAGLC